ncbi:hypothetical protein ABE096_08645 [Robertmurraya massiliosenegalensis]|uniref:hypothetical protein n=1 Tax=Robertmurraya TaxID=2837507 RepID=UPI0039A78593
MADYKYIGLTAYITRSMEGLEKLGVLAEAIERLQMDVEQPVLAPGHPYENLVQSEDYQFLYNNDSVCYTDESTLPMNTPLAYHGVSLQGMNIKGRLVWKLYIPAVAKDKGRLETFIYEALDPVLRRLFGEDLLSIKTRESVEYEDFKDAKETILLSVEKRLAVTA